MDGQPENIMPCVTSRQGHKKPLGYPKRACYHGFVHDFIREIYVLTNYNSTGYKVTVVFRIKSLIFIV